MNVIKRKINTFSKIEIIPNSLIVFDIDETIMTFDYDKKDLENPIKLDNENLKEFIENLKKNKCKIIFLTARCPSTRTKTIEDLKKINLRFNPNHVYFDLNKGQKLYDIVTKDYKDIENIIFIDDLFLNIKSVESTFCFTKYKLYLYLIQHI